MKLYKIAPKQYLENYTGLGASFKRGARWNLKGHPALYFALSPSVAMLEMANYLPSPRLVPKSYRLGEYSLPDIYFDSFENDVPEDWAQFPYPSSTQCLGGNWLTSQQNVALVLPSAATPNGLESIVLVNPLHVKISELKLVRTYQDIFNKRAFSGI